MCMHLFHTDEMLYLELGNKEIMYFVFFVNYKSWKNDK